MYKFEVYESESQPGQWYWRLRCLDNGKIVADSAEAYASKWNAKRAVRKLTRTPLVS
jgi:uncharacterized protein YegP (UPF0339 family)